MVLALPSAGVEADAPLRANVRLLGDILGGVLVEQEGEELFSDEERIRALSRAAREGAPRDELRDAVRGLDLERQGTVLRAFAMYFQLANIAEQHHRVRRRRDYARMARHPQPGSCEEVFNRLRAGGVAADVLAAAVGDLRIELVFTAHPTEIVRRTLLQAQRRIADTLGVHDRTDLAPAEAADSVERLRREIAIMWQTQEARAGPISPLDEIGALLARGGTIKVWPCSRGARRRGTLNGSSSRSGGTRTASRTSSPVGPSPRR